MTAEESFSQLGHRIDADRRWPEIRAEAAENYTGDAVSFAIAAVQEAEYAVLARSGAGSQAET